jgi:hypothetical protein
LVKRAIVKYSMGLDVMYSTRQMIMILKFTILVAG